MNQDVHEPLPDRALEILIAEKVFSRLKTQLLVVYLVSIGLATAIAWSLAWEYHTLARLGDARIAEYRLLADEKLQELHRLDLQELASRTRAAGRCDVELTAAEVGALLRRELGELPSSEEVERMTSTASSFGICEVGEIRGILDEEASGARIDTVYRLLLGRGADPVGRFIYGYWLTSGLEIEAVSRDIMASSEFRRLKRLSPES